MPAASVATTSALTGPCTRPQIFLTIARGSPPSFAISDGFVVAPSMMPYGTNVSKSLMLPLSMNSFMTLPHCPIAPLLVPPLHHWIGERAHAFDVHGH